MSGTNSACITVQLLSPLKAGNLFVGCFIG
jgi:hypothetical protein